MRAFLASVSWVAIEQNATQFNPEQLQKLLWAAKPFLETSPPSLMLPQTLHGPQLGDMWVMALRWLPDRKLGETPIKLQYGFFFSFLYLFLLFLGCWHWMRSSSRFQKAKGMISGSGWKTESLKMIPAVLQFVTLLVFPVWKCQQNMKCVSPLKLLPWVWVWCMEFACSPVLGGFPPGTPVSSYSPETCSVDWAKWHVNVTTFLKIVKKYIYIQWSPLASTALQRLQRFQRWLDG